MVRAKARQRIGAATDFSMYSLIFVCSDMDENTDGARRTERTVRMQEQAGEKGQVSQEARSSRDRFPGHCGHTLRAAQAFASANTHPAISAFDACSVPLQR
jgi:hypothetical protein